MKVKIFFLTIILSLISGLSYSNSNTNDADFLKLLNELFDTPAISATTDNIENKEITIDKNLREKVAVKSEQTFQEFIDHFNKYYPRVFVIREKFFSTMTPEHLAKALEQIIDVIANRPWFYLEQLFKPIIKKLENKEKLEWKKANYDIEFLVKKFKNEKLAKLSQEHCFENFMADQLVYFHNFLKYAKVDLVNNLVFYDKRRSFSGLYSRRKKNQNNEVPLRKYWSDNGENVHFDFYELCADYWARLFLDSISTEQLNNSYRYYDDLKEVLNCLRNSPNEAKINEYVQKYKNLLKLLKQKTYSRYTELEKDNEFSELMEYWDS